MERFEFIVRVLFILPMIFINLFWIIPVMNIDELLKNIIILSQIYLILNNIRYFADFFVKSRRGDVK